LPQQLTYKAEATYKALAKVTGRELRSLQLKMINDLKEDSNDQIEEVRKPIQELDKKATWKFSKEVGII
jgi:hypothetical protein